ncbi:MAG TPA: ABC transporter substrate-binding protein [Alphaproteobacteria bacterium]|nr:ABC transporter substrate-binding protein [Alphaproteobacteria bacterium]
MAGLMSTGAGGFPRRRFLKGMAAAGAALAMTRAPAIAQGFRDVSFTTSWLPEGPNLFAYVARDKGFWKARGLNVSVARGSGSGAAIQAVGAGKFDFGMGATPTAIIQAAKGLPIVCIGQINYDALMGFGVLENSPIRKPKDLEGKSIGSSVTSGEYPFLPLYAQKAGIAFDKLKIVQLDSKVRERALVEKQVDAVSAFATSTIPTLVSEGTEVRFMLFRSVGIDFYGQSLTTQPDRIGKDPGLCAAFVDGAMEAIKYSMTNFDESMDLFLKANDEIALSRTGREYTRLGLGLTIATNLVPELKEHGFGYADPAKVEAMTDMVLQYGVGKDAKRPNTGELFTNAFASKLKLSTAELAAAEKAAQPFLKYLG